MKVLSCEAKHLLLLPSFVQSITLTATLVQAGMTLKWQSSFAPFTTTSATYTIALAPVGQPNIQIINTFSFDGVTSLTYTVTITRVSNALALQQTNQWSGEGNTLDSFCTGQTDAVSTPAVFTYQPGVVGQAFRFGTPTHPHIESLERD
jgi:hypothetical protein